MRGVSVRTCSILAGVGSLSLTLRTYEPAQVTEAWPGMDAGLEGEKGWDPATSREGLELTLPSPQLKPLPCRPSSTDRGMRCPLLAAMQAHWATKEALSSCIFNLNSHKNKTHTHTHIYNFKYQTLWGFMTDSRVLLQPWWAWLLLPKSNLLHDSYFCSPILFSSNDFSGVLISFPIYHVYAFFF